MVCLPLNHKMKCLLADGFGTVRNLSSHLHRHKWWWVTAPHWKALDGLGYPSDLFAGSLFSQLIPNSFLQWCVFKQQFADEHFGVWPCKYSLLIEATLAVKAAFLSSAVCHPNDPPVSLPSHCLQMKR